VRHAAGNDEKTRQQEHPVERNVGALPDEVDQRDGDGEVGKADQHVRDEVQANEARLPGVADAVRQVAIHPALRGRDRDQCGRGDANQRDEGQRLHGLGDVHGRLTGRQERKH
jgi:hypothetical protein